jgi:hypothetical protein
MIQDRSFADRFHNGKWQVSTAGGSWRHDGKGLFYRSLDKRITSAGISMDASRLVVGNVAPLFQVNVAMSLGWFYDVSTDGKRFVVLNQDPRRGCRAPGARGQLACAP